MFQPLGVIQPPTTLKAAKGFFRPTPALAFVVSMFDTPGVDILLRHGVDEDLVVLGPRGVALELPGNVEAHGLLHPVEAGAGNRHYLGADWHRHWHP